MCSRGRGLLAGRTQVRLHVDEAPPPSSSWTSASPGSVRNSVRSGVLEDPHCLPIFNAGAVGISTFPSLRVEAMKAGKRSFTATPERERTLPLEAQRQSTNELERTILERRQTPPSTRQTLTPCGHRVHRARCPHGVLVMSRGTVFQAVAVLCSE